MSTNVTEPSLARLEFTPGVPPVCGAAFFIVMPDHGGVALACWDWSTSAPRLVYVDSREPIASPATAWVRLPWFHEIGGEA